MNLNFNSKGEDVFFATLFKNKGVVYGGYIRDLISGDPINDIDVVISKYHIEQFCREMKDLEYIREENDHGLTFSKKDHLRIDCCISDFSPEDTILGGECYPDYDVNLLTYNGEIFYNWASEDDEESIENIVKNIKSKRSKEIYYDENRRKKIEAKGYKVIH